MIPIAPGFFSPYRASASAPDTYVVFSAFMGDEAVGTNDAYGYWVNDTGGLYYSEYQTSVAQDLMSYVYTSAVHPLGYKINYPDATPDFVSAAFALGGTYQITAFNRSGSSDTAYVDFEFLDGFGAVIAAVRIEKNGSFTEQMKYGASLASLSTAPVTTGAFPQPYGNFTFDEGNIYYENLGVPGTYGFIDDWSFACAAADIRSIRVVAMNASSATSGSSWAGVRMVRIA